MCRHCTEKSHWESARLRRTPRPPRAPQGFLSYGSSSTPGPLIPCPQVPDGCPSLVHGVNARPGSLGRFWLVFWDVNQTVGSGLEKRRVSSPSNQVTAMPTAHRPPPSTHHTPFPFPLRPKHSLHGPYPPSMRHSSSVRVGCGAVRCGCAIRIALQQLSAHPISYAEP